MTLTSSLTALAALAAVLALVLLAGRLARRTGFARSGAGPRRLALQESLALDARRRVHLLSCDGRDIVLLTGGTQDVLIGWVPDRPAGAV